MNKTQHQTSGGESRAYRVRSDRAPDIDVRRLRRLMRMSQIMFAQLFAISTGTLRHWEAGERRPSGPARVLLHVIAHHPGAVRTALRCRVWKQGEPHLLPGVSGRASLTVMGPWEDESIDPPPKDV